ncbi:MAG: single-stranded DNA-binding protein [Syntrophorhabdaceae bacterium]
MSSLNRVLLIGRLGADPELRYTSDQKPVATFRMATSESYKDRSDQWQEKTEWHTIKAWRYLAEKAAEKLKKGSLVYVEGKIESREYEGKDGIKRRIYEIVASDLKPISTGQGQSQGSYEDRRSSFNSPRPHAEDDFVPEVDDDVPM